MAELVVGLGLVVTGAVGALVFAALVRGRESKQLTISAIALVVASAVYLLPLIQAKPVEPVVWVALGLAAVFAIGTRWSPWILVVGWLLHALWDVIAHFLGLDPLFGAYAPLCLGFDVMLAIVIMLRHAVTPEAA